MPPRAPGGMREARWYLWDGGFLFMGRASGTLSSHAHHAVQVTLGLDGPVEMGLGDEPLSTYTGAVVAPDVQHRLCILESLAAVLLVDPESREGRWLCRSYREDLMPVPAEKAAASAAALRKLWDEPVDAPETARIIHSVVRTVCAGPPPQHALDPRIVRALEVIRRMDTARISLDEVARAVFLSPSRFAHLFSEQVGLPFRRYLLWRRLTAAVLAAGRGSTLSAAAHACGFSDSAHLTRTWYQMFGQSPTAQLRAGEFDEIPAPFELPFAAG